MQYIYARCSTEKQDTQNQISMLQVRYPQAETYEETASGVRHRPVLEGLLAKLQKGDELIIAELSRLGRRTSEVLTICEDLDKRGIRLISEREKIDMGSIAGRLVLSILAAVYQMEREQLAERTRAALAAKKKAGVRLGAPAKYSIEDIARVRELRTQGMSTYAIAKAVGMSQSRVSQLLRADSSGRAA